MGGMNDKRRNQVRAGAAGAEAVLATWLLVSVVSILVFTVNISSPVLNEVRWQDAAHVGTSLWMLSLGSPLTIAGAQISLMPLLSTIVFVLVFRLFVHRNSVGGVDEVVAVAGGAAVTTAVVSLAALPQTFKLHAILVAALIGACVALYEWASWSKPTGVWWDWFQAAREIARPVLLALGAGAFILFIAGIVMGWNRVTEIHGYYLLNPVQGTVFSVAQLFYLPTAIVWALAFASGVGFIVGTDTAFSALGVSTQPLPAIPLLGALPGPSVHMPWLIGVIVLIGFAVGIFRGGKSKKLGEAMARGGFGVLYVLVVLSVLGLLASGGIGPGRLAETGINAPLFAAIVALEVGGGLLLGLLVRNAQLHDIIRARFAGQKAKKASQSQDGELDAVTPESGEAAADSDPVAEAAGEVKEPVTDVADVAQEQGADAAGEGKEPVAAGTEIAASQGATAPTAASPSYAEFAADLIDDLSDAAPVASSPASVTGSMEVVGTSPEVAASSPEVAGTNPDSAPTTKSD